MGLQVPGETGRDHRDHQRQQQCIWTEHVAQVLEALFVLRAGGIFGHGSVGNEKSVVTHAEDLVAHRNHRRSGGERQAHPPRHRSTHHQQQRQSADDGQFGPDEGGQTGVESEQQGGDHLFASLKDAAIWGGPLTPSDQLAPQHRGPEDTEGNLEAAGGEVTRRRKRDVDQRSERQQQRPAGVDRTGTLTDAIEPSGAVHGDRDGRYGEDQGNPQHDVLGLGVGDPAPEPDQVRPHRRRVGLDTLPLVEDGSVAGQQVPDGAQDDETVVGDPPALPCAVTEDRTHHDSADPQRNGGRIDSAAEHAWVSYRPILNCWPVFR